MLSISFKCSLSCAIVVTLDFVECHCLENQEATSTWAPSSQGSIRMWKRDRPLGWIARGGYGSWRSQVVSALRWLKIGRLHAKALPVESRRFCWSCKPGSSMASVAPTVASWIGWSTTVRQLWRPQWLCTVSDYSYYVSLYATDSWSALCFMTLWCLWTVPTTSLCFGSSGRLC